MEKPHPQAILGTALVASFAYLLGLLSLNGSSKVFTARYEFEIIFGTVTLAASVICLVLTAFSEKLKLERLAFQTFIVGFLLLVITTIDWVILDMAGPFTINLPSIFIGLVIGIVMGIFFAKVVRNIKARD